MKQVSASLPQLEHIRPNFTKVHVSGVDLWFSYETCIAFGKPGGMVFIDETFHSMTTSRHRGQIEREHESERLSACQFAERLSIALGGAA